MGQMQVKCKSKCNSGQKNVAFTCAQTPWKQKNVLHLVMHKHSVYAAKAIDNEQRMW